jgi:hypothetical protein
MTAIICYYDMNDLLDISFEPKVNLYSQKNFVYKHWNKAFLVIDNMQLL